MSELDQIAKQAQRCFSSNPAIVLGSGVSAPFGLPTMGPLSEHLLKVIKPDGKEVTETWDQIRTALLRGDHLELALTGKHIPAPLVGQIVLETWRRMAEGERAAFKQGLSGAFNYRIGAILLKLFQSSNSAVDIVTTNYDRLIEFACDLTGLHHIAGFLPGYLNALDPADGVTLKRHNRSLRLVRLWKVHGSMDWFARPDGTALRAPVFSEIPDGLEPLIVTPGVSKYERISEEPFRSTMAGADGALQSANGYLCFGFGFRDKQIEPKIVDRIRKASVPIVVAARTLTDEAKTFLQNSAGDDVLALERDGNGTRVRTLKNWDGVKLDDEYWSVDGFLKLVT